MEKLLAGSIYFSQPFVLVGVGWTEGVMSTTGADGVLEGGTLYLAIPQAAVAKTMTTTRPMAQTGHFVEVVGLTGAGGGVGVGEYATPGSMRAFYQIHEL